MRVKNNVWFSGPLALVLCFVWLNQAEGARTEFRNGLKVAATIYPLADITQQIAGSSAEVITILPPGANPHAFELTPKLVKALEDDRVVFMIGHNFDEWVKAVSESLRGVKVIVVDQHIDLIQDESENVDPHYWLSIKNAKQIARNIAQTLTELDPHGKDRYQKNLESYLSELGETDQKMRQLFSELHSREVVTYHNGWQYFARDYGFKIVGSVESSQGSEPTPKRLRELSKTVAEYRIRALFSEPAASRRLAESVARDFGLRLYELDSLGGSEEKKNFLDLMITNAQVIHEALRDG